MSESEQSNSGKTTQTDQSDVEVSRTDDDKKTKLALPKISGFWWLVAAALISIAILSMIAACFALQRLHLRDDGFRSVGQGMRAEEFGDDFPMHRGSNNRTPSGMMRWGGLDGDLSEGSSRVFGVVTAVNDSTVTVAGNGTTTKVIVDDNTTYLGDDKPAKVNDTIMAIGTKDGDTITATRVMLQRQ